MFKHRDVEFKWKNKQQRQLHTENESVNQMNGNFFDGYIAFGVWNLDVHMYTEMVFARKAITKKKLTQIHSFIGVVQYMHSGKQASRHTLAHILVKERTEKRQQLLHFVH